MAIQWDVERHLQIRAGGHAAAPLPRAGRTVGRSDAEGSRGPRRLGESPGVGWVNLWFIDVYHDKL